MAYMRPAPLVGFATMTTTAAQRGLNTRQSKILAFVVTTPGCRSGEVGARVIADGNDFEWYATEKASRSLAQLAEKGFITRKAIKGERRAFTYTATAKGRKHIEKSVLPAAIAPAKAKTTRAIKVKAIVAAMPAAKRATKGTGKKATAAA